MNVRFIRLFVLCFALLLVAGGIMLQQPAQTLANPDTMVDNFSQTQTVTQSGLGSTWQRAVTGGSDILGVEREVTVTVQTVGSGSQAQIDVNGGGLGRMAQSQDANVTAYSIFTYDGNDNSPNINYSGLGNVDLTTGGDNAFVAIVHSNNFGTTRDVVTVTVYSDATHCSYLAVRLPNPPVVSGDPAVALVFRYANTNLFSACSGYSAASFTSVNVIQLQVTGGQEDNDIVLELFETTRLDYGDLPSGPVVYNAITTGTNSAGHVILAGEPKLGSQEDAEDNGQQNTSDAKKDNTTGSPNDEDGVGLFGTQWNAGSTNTANVVVSGASGCLIAWIDWAGDGIDDGDLVVNNQAVVVGNNTVTINVPGGTSSSGTFYSRWRIFERNDSVGPDNDTCNFPSFSATGAFTGRFGSGEVEDHNLGFNTPTAVTLNEISATVESNRWLQLGALGVLAAATIAFVTMRRK